jgi:hypothetical protein
MITTVAQYAIPLTFGASVRPATASDEVHGRRVTVCNIAS